MLSRGRKNQTLVKVPRGRVGRMVFAGGQAAAAAAAWRAVKDARAKGDRLAAVHGALTGAVVLLTMALALRTARHDAASAPEDQAAAPDGAGSPAAPADAR